MTPGIAGNPPFPEKAKKGAVVAIASTDNPSVPLAVGRCLIDVSALGLVQGARGHAVQNMHWAGDELWDYSTASKPGRKAPDELPEWLAEELNVASLAASTGDMKLGDDEEEDEEGGVPLDDGPVSSVQQEKADAQEEGEDKVSQEEVMAQAEIPRMTTKGKEAGSLKLESDADGRQKSTMPFGTPFCMASTTISLPTQINPNLASTFLSHSLLSCQI